MNAREIGRAAFGAVAGMIAASGVPGVEEPVRKMTFGKPKPKEVKFVARRPHETTAAWLHRKWMDTFGSKNARRRAEGRTVRIFQSPGAVAKGPARPTAAKAGAELNYVEFRNGRNLLFSDGSFRNPGRRRIVLTGQDTALSGRQLRKLRKQVRRAAKTRDAAAVLSATVSA